MRDYVDSATDGGEEDDRIENWTKWRMFLSQSTLGEETVVFSQESLSVSNLTLPVRVGFERRPDQLCVIARGPDGQLEVTPDSGGHQGIYDHYRVETRGSTVRFIPNFMFGVSHEVVDHLYPGGPEEFPISGMLTKTTGGDRLLVQCYMNLVVLSVIFLLWINNPPTKSSTKT